jgi:ZIP family zinc transporter
MLNAFLWGLFASSSLILGGMIALRFRLSNKMLGVIMAFGAGTLISAVAYELIFEAVKLGKSTGYPAFGLFAGALTFVLSDLIIDRMGAANRKKINASHGSNLVIPMVLAIILDGIPESFVIGMGVYEQGEVSLAMLVAVFISNMPESIAGSSGMKAGGWGRWKIFLLWLIIGVVCAGASVAGYLMFEHTSDQWLSFIHAFAGGAILVMISNSMTPEAHEHGGRLAGIFTVLGFAVAVAIVVMEQTAGH